MTWQKIRLRDADGKLVAAGYQWGEPCILRDVAIAAFAVAGAAGVLIAVSLLKKDVPGAVAVFAASAICAACAAGLYDIRFRPRSLVFALDGSMHMPNGVPDYIWRRRVDGHHSNIASIAKIRDEEMRDGKPHVSHRVAIYGKAGHIVRVSDALHPDAAHMVVVQLLAALQEIRDEITWRVRMQ